MRSAIHPNVGDHESVAWRRPMVADWNCCTCSLEIRLQRCQRTRSATGHLPCRSVQTRQFLADVLPVHSDGQRDHHAAARSGDGPPADTRPHNGDLPAVDRSRREPPEPATVRTRGNGWRQGARSVHALGTSSNAHAASLLDLRPVMLAATTAAATGGHTLLPQSSMLSAFVSARPFARSIT